MLHMFVLLGAANLKELLILGFIGTQQDGPPKEPSFRNHQTLVVIFSTKTGFSMKLVNTDSSTKIFFRWVAQPPIKILKNPPKPYNLNIEDSTFATTQSVFCRSSVERQHSLAFPPQQEPLTFTSFTLTHQRYPGILEMQNVEQKLR